FNIRNNDFSGYRAASAVLQTGEETRCGRIVTLLLRYMSSDYYVERISGPEDLPYFPDHLARYRFALQWAPQSRVLDICCGVGYGTLVLAAAGARKVVGIDISAEAIETARSRSPLTNLSFFEQDACAPHPDPAGWDLITCFEGIEHVA